MVRETNYTELDDDDFINFLADSLKSMKEGFQKNFELDPLYFGRLITFTNSLLNEYEKRFGEIENMDNITLVDN